MREIEWAVLADDIDEVEYWMNRERFHPDDLMHYAQSEYMVEFLVRHGADRPNMMLLMPWCNNVVIAAAAYYYDNYIRS